MASQTMIGREGVTRMGEPWAWIDPADELEPENKPADELRKARMQTVRMLGDFAIKMHAALTREGNMREALITLYGISFAMGLSIVDNETMSDVAARLGCERATISKIAVGWNLSHDLQPSFHQKTEEANDNYAKARREVVKRNGSLPTVPARGSSV